MIKVKRKSKKKKKKLYKTLQTYYFSKLIIRFFVLSRQEPYLCIQDISCSQFSQTKTHRSTCPRERLKMGDFTAKLVITLIKRLLYTPSYRERSGSVVECLTRDREAAVSSLAGVTAL